MKENFRIPVSLSTTKIDKNQKGIWAKISYRETTTTIPQFINALGEGYAFAHLFVHNGDTFNYKERLNCNYKGSQVVAIDIDHTTISFEKFNDIMTSTEIKPSITYTTQNNKIKGYRYRALYVVDELMSSEIYKEIYANLSNEIVCYFDNGTIEIDNNANKLNQQFAGNGTENFEYKEGNVYCLKWLCERYKITTHNNLNAEVEKVHDRDIINNGNKVSDGYIISTNEKPQDGHIISGENNDNIGGRYRYIISHDNDSSSNINYHANLNNEKNVHGNYIHDMFNKSINKLIEGGRDRYIIKKEEEHYKTIASSLNDSVFINDYYNESINDLVHDYISTFPSYEYTNVQYNDDDLYYLVPENYMEIKRKWHYEEVEKCNGDTYRITKIEKCKDGQGRRRRLFINLILRRLIYPQISFVHLLFNAVYELKNYIDNVNTNDKITKYELAEIAVNAYFENMDKWQNLKNYHKPKYKINKAYCLANNLNARREAIKVRGLINREKKEKRWLEIDKYFNPQLSNKDNLELLKTNGIEIKITALKDYKRARGFTKSKKTKQTITEINANKAIISNNNKIMEQQHTIMQTSKQGANNKQIEPLNDLVRESENNTIKVMLDDTMREVTLTEIRSELFDGSLLTLTNNLIGIRAYELDDDLKYTMAVNNSDLKPSFIVTNKKDDVICFYALNYELNNNDYKTISNEICKELKGCINEFSNERIVSLVSNYDFERGENFGCINNEIIYNTQWLLQRFSINLDNNEKVRDGYIISPKEDDELNNYSPTYFNNDFWSNKDVLI